MSKQIPNSSEEESRQAENAKGNGDQEIKDLFRKAIKSLKRIDTDPEFREKIFQRIS